MPIYDPTDELATDKQLKKIFRKDKKRKQELQEAADRIQQHLNIAREIHKKLDAEQAESEKKNGKA